MARILKYPLELLLPGESFVQMVKRLNRVEEQIASRRCVTAHYHKDYTNGQSKATAILYPKGKLAPGQVMCQAPSAIDLIVNHELSNVG